eukprot:2712992-Pyramimonas_sp.AAC.2
MRAQRTSAPPQTFGYICRPPLRWFAFARGLPKPPCSDALLGIALVIISYGLSRQPAGTLGSCIGLGPNGGSLATLSR